MKPMPLFRAFSFALAFALLAACKPAAESPSAPPVAAAPALIPQPATLQAGDGQFVVDAGTPEALAQRNKLETAKWAKAIRDARIEPQ